MTKGSASVDNVVFHAGFPNAAEDNRFGSLSFDKLVVKHRASTFFWRLETEVGELGWPSGSLVVVDRAPESKNNHLVVASTEEDFVICRYNKSGFKKLDGSGFDIEPVLWGVITYVLQPVAPL